MLRGRTRAVAQHHAGDDCQGDEHPVRHTYSNVAPPFIRSILV